MTDQEQKERGRPASGAITHEKSQKAHKPQRRRSRRQRCRAVAKGTGSQCSKRAMPGVNYCRSHYPWKAKGPSLLVGALIGGIIALGLPLAFDALTTSKAEAKITRFTELAGSIYPGTAEQEALDRFGADYALLGTTAYREVGLTCHAWKNAYLCLRPELLEDTGHDDADIWQNLEGAGTPKFSAETWERYRPLFDQAIDACAGQLDEIMAIHGTLLAPDFRTLVMETKESFELVQRTYRFARMMSDAANRGPVFEYPFREMIRAVSKLARESERRQVELMPRTD